MKYNSPILLDTNILLYFEGNLEILCSHFDKLLIHEYVIKEVLSQNIKNEIEKIQRELKNIEIVGNDYIKSLDDINEKIYKLSKEELSDTFNLNNKKDIGECETLLYAKFNKVGVISSQDTTVWSFIDNARHFTSVKCMTIQDIAILINGDNAKIAKYLYNKYSRNEHKYEYFRKYANINKNSLPCYIEFENIRIQSFIELVNDYLEWTEKDGIDVYKVESIIAEIAKDNKNSCLNCLFSRLDKKQLIFSGMYSKTDKHNPVFMNRVCSQQYSFNDTDCIKYKSEFEAIIKQRDKD